jgi:acyl-CoA synthetase (AMP-forming)/AMP-acid ligase II
MTEPVMTERFDSLGDLLEAVASEYPGHVAFVDGAQRLTFGQWHTRARELAGALSRTSSC